MVKAKIPDEVLKQIFPKKIKKARISDDIYRQLKEMILSGKVKKGEPLIQEKLGLKFNVSRMTLRPVLSKLNEEGLIIYVPWGGAFVK